MTRSPRRAGVQHSSLWPALAILTLGFSWLGSATAQGVALGAETRALTRVFSPIADKLLARGQLSGIERAELLELLTKSSRATVSDGPALVRIFRPPDGPICPIDYLYELPALSEEARVALESVLGVRRGRRELPLGADNASNPMVIVVMRENPWNADVPPEDRKFFRRILKMLEDLERYMAPAHRAHTSEHIRDLLDEIERIQADSLSAKGQAVLASVVQRAGCLEPKAGIPDSAQCAREFEQLSGRPTAERLRQLHAVMLECLLTLQSCSDALGPPGSPVGQPATIPQRVSQLLPIFESQLTMLKLPPLEPPKRLGVEESADHAEGRVIERLFQASARVFEMLRWATREPGVDRRLSGQSKLGS